MILSSDKSSERNLSSFFDIKKPRRMEHLQSEEPFSSDPYFSNKISKIQIQNMAKFSQQPCWIGAKIQISLISCIVKWFNETEL